MKSYSAVHATRVLGMLLCLGAMLNCGSSNRLETLTITPANPTLAKGTNLQLIATGTYQDGSQHVLTGSVTWQSSKSEIAAISQAGQITAMGEGAAMVSAAYEGVTGNTNVTVGTAALIGISVTPNPASVPVGESLQLTATGSFSDGTTQNVTQSVSWSSSTANIASVTAAGSVYAGAPGTATITATFGSVSGNTSLTVGQAALIGITVTPNPTSLPLGETEQLTATGNYSNGTVQDLTQLVSWASGTTGVASVNTSGSVAAKATGLATITATLGTVAGNASVTVSQPALLGIAVTPAQSTVAVGETAELTATGNFSDGSSKALTQSVMWASSAPGVVTVAPSGFVVAKQAGTATITAAVGSISGSASVTAGQAALLFIDVSPNRSSLPQGESVQLTATGGYSDGSKQNLTQSVTWTSSAATIASVSSSGSVLSNALGRADIRATLGSMIGTASIDVEAPVVVSLTIAPATLSIVLGSSSQLQATANMSNGTTQALASGVSWSSTPIGIVNVSNSGVVTAQQVGSTTVFGTYSGATGTATVTVLPLLFLNYFDRAKAISSGVDGTLRLVNSGLTAGPICAMVYVFDRNQEMNECCGCSISDNGERTLSLLNDLTANPLTGKYPAAGVITVIPSAVGQNGLCDASSLNPAGAIAGFETNIQGIGTGGTPVVTETEFARTHLNPVTAEALSSECSFIETLGSGAGICTCGANEE